MDSNDREYADLTVIKGIGPARQEWLRERFQVRTFQDLADLSVDQIESQLIADEQIPNRSAIVSWLLQAQELAASAPRSPQPDVSPPDAATSVVAVDAQVAAKGNPLARANGWKPFATFVVEFQTLESAPEERQTAVQHMEKDTGKTWPGIEAEQLCQWMLDQMGEEIRQRPEEELLAEAPPTVRPPATLPVTVKINQIQARQPPQAERPTGIGQHGQAFGGLVKSGAPFALEVSFELAGPGAADIASRRTPYSAQFHVYNLSTGTTTWLGETQPDTLVQGKSSYTAVLPETALQEGLYRLHVSAVLQSTPPSGDLLEVPLLQVV